MRPQRSLRLEKRSTRSLDTLSGASGEIFYDADNATLRMYTTNAGDQIKMATQEWVNGELGVQGSSIQYANIVGAPTGLSAFTNDAGFITASEGGITSDDLIWVVYPTLADLPAASDNHGMFAHVHGEGKAYYAHAGAWIQLADQSAIDNIDLTGLGITYSISELNGVLTLLSSEGVESTVNVLTASGATLTGNLNFGDDVSAAFGATGQLSIKNDGVNGPTINSSGTLRLTPTTSLTVTTADVGITTTNALVFNSQAWPQEDGTSGYFLSTDGTGQTAWTNSKLGFSVTTAAAGTAALEYNSDTGVFTYTPPNLSSLGFSAGVVINEFSSDATLAGNSIQAVPTEGAVKSYVDTAVANGAGAQDVYKSILSDDGTAVATGLTDTLTIQGGTNIATAVQSNSDVLEINLTAFGINFLSDVDTTSSSPITGQVLKWDGSNWAPGTDDGTGGGGITLADARNGLSVTQASASGTGALSYANASGAFTYTPPESTPPAGSNKEIQFNNSGSFGTDSTFVFDDPIGSGDLRLGIGIATPANLWSTGPAAAQNTVIHIHNPVSGNTGAGVKMTRQATGASDSDGLELFLSNTDEGYLYHNEDENIHIGTNQITRFTVSSGGVQVASQGDLRLGDSDNSNYVGFKAPTTVGSNYIWTLPAIDGSAGHVLSTNGAGVLSWVAQSVPAQSFASLTGKPTTLAGYGITDGLSAGATPMLSEVSSTINGATGTVVHNTTTSGVFYHTAPAANFTANFTNVPTTGDRITTVALIIAQGVTQYMPTAVQIGGAAQTIEWFGGSVPGGTANGFDIVSFTLIRQSSTWTVLGASSTYG